MNNAPWRTAEDHPGSHPQLDALIDYHQGRLDPAAADGIQEHLVRCPQCAALLLDLESFSSAEAAPPEDTTAARFLTRQVVQRRRTERWRMIAAVAASLAVVALVPLFVGATHRGGRRTIVAPLPAPEANLPIASLVPRSSLRGASEINRLQLESGHQLVGIVLTTSEAAGGRDLSLLVADASGRQVLALHGLRATALGSFNVGLPAPLLPPGRYQLHLVAAGRFKPAAVEDYDLLVAPAEPAGLRPVP